MRESKYFWLMSNGIFGVDKSCIHGRMMACLFEDYGNLEWSGHILGFFYNASDDVGTRNGVLGLCNNQT